MSEYKRSSWEDTFNRMPVGPLGLIAMPGCEEMGEKINSWLLRRDDTAREEGNESLYSMPGGDRKTFLIKCLCPRFGTGESKAVLRETVRGYDLYILVDVCAHNVTYKMYGQEVPMSPDDHFQDLKRVISAVEGKAKRITVIMPMLYESRQHRRTTRESLDCALGLQELERMGINNIVTFDAHDPRVQNSIPLSSFENIMPNYQMIKAMCKKIPDLHFDKDHMMVVSPDEGAMNRNIFFSTVLGIDLGMFYKRRDYTTVINGRNPIVAHEYLGNSVEGKDVLVVDDMISSGDSVLDLCRELKERKANRIFAAASYAFFTNGIDAFQKAHDEGLLSYVISTNLSYTLPELRKADWFIEADMSKYIAFIISTLNHDHSLHALMNPYDRIKRVLENYKETQKAAAQKAAQTEAGAKAE